MEKNWVESIIEDTEFNCNCEIFCVYEVDIYLMEIWYIFKNYRKMWNKQLLEFNYN